MLCKLFVDFIESLLDFELISLKIGVKFVVERDFIIMILKYGLVIIRKINIFIIWEIVCYIKCIFCDLFGFLIEFFFYLLDRIFF